MKLWKITDNIVSIVHFQGCIFNFLSDRLTKPPQPPPLPPSTYILLFVALFYPFIIHI